MSDKEFDFQKELKKAIFNADPKLDRHELLTDIFKIWVARLFEYISSRKKKNHIEFSVMVEVKRNLINEFRKTELGEYQKSVEQYSDLFEETVKEILNDAALAHAGKDKVEVKQTLEINREAYIYDHGLLMPKHLKN